VEFAGFLDVPIASTSTDDAVTAVLDAAHGTPTTFRLVNAGTFDAATSQPDYWTLLRGRGVNLPDGRPLRSILARTTAKGQRCDQVRGPWLFEACLDRGRERGTRHFLLGATEETLDQLSAQIESKFPGAILAGAYAPPFGERSSAEMALQDAAITDSGADIVWVALGTPKQDTEALRVLQATGITTAAVGAAFDFTAGTKRAAPHLVSRLHAEWLFRFVSEPRRLWRRYLIGNARFLLLGARHVMTSRR